MKNAILIMLALLSPLCLWGFVFSMGHQGVVHYFVSTEGSDITGDGSFGAPWATVEKARDELRNIPGEFDGDILVTLAPGTYRIAAPIVFTEADSGRNGHHITYRGTPAATAGSAVLSGAVPLDTGWICHDQDTDVWKIDISAWGVEPSTLYESGRRAVEARYPNRYEPDETWGTFYPASRAPYFKSVGGGDGPAAEAENFLLYDPSDWAGYDLAVLSGLSITLWHNGADNWHSATLPVNGINTSAASIRINNLDKVDSNPSNNIYVRGMEEVGIRYFLHGSPAFLDRRGEFFCDAAGGFLYYKSYGGGNPGQHDVRFPLVKNIFDFRGTDASSMVSNITLQGLAVQETDGTAPAHEWWRLDDTVSDYGATDTAAVRISDAEGIRIERCRIADSGRHGILIHGANEGIEVEDSWIHDVGICGIALSNRRSNWQPSLNHRIENCLVHDVGQLGVDAACLTVFCASDSTFRNLELSHSPRYGISMRGSVASGGSENPFPPAAGNLFEYISIGNCMQDSGDGGGLHLAGVNSDATAHTNTFDQMLITDMQSVIGQNDSALPRGIYFDWPGCTLYQTLGNIEVREYESLAWKDNLNPDQDFANVSWLAGFDSGGMDYGNIGLTASFPDEFEAGRPAHLSRQDFIIEDSTMFANGGAYPPENEHGSYEDTGSGWGDTAWGHGFSPRSRQVFLSSDSPSATASWTPDITVPGSYEVLVWKSHWQSANYPEDHVSAADYTVITPVGSVTSRLDQTECPVEWESLGIHDFPTGQVCSVRLMNGMEGAYTNLRMRADAMRFVRVADMHENFSCHYESGINLVGQNGWVEWISNRSPMVTSDGGTSWYVAGRSDIDARAKKPVNVGTDDGLVTLEAAFQLGTIDGAGINMNHAGLGNSSLNTMGLNIGVNNTGVFFSTGLLYAECNYGYLASAIFTPTDTATIYTVRAVVDLNHARVGLYVSVNGDAFRQLAFDASMDTWFLPVDPGSVTGLDAAFIRFGEHPITEFTMWKYDDGSDSNGLQFVVHSHGFRERALLVLYVRNEQFFVA